MQAVQAVQAVSERLRARPEVKNVAVSSLMPLASIRRPGRVKVGSRAPQEQTPLILPIFSNAVSSSYFETPAIAAASRTGIES